MKNKKDFKGITGELFAVAFQDPWERSIKRLGYAIWALVAYQVFFTVVILFVLKVNGII